MNEEFTVNGLPLPPMLVDLLKKGNWRHPGDNVLQEVIPFLDDPVNFLESVPQMRLNSKGTLADIGDSSKLFHEVRGSKSISPVELPWLDADKAVFIAVNRELGADVAIALDYRTQPDNPRVVASHWLPREHIWREVTATFSEFVERLGLN